MKKKIKKSEQMEKLPPLNKNTEIAWSTGNQEMCGYWALVLSWRLDTISHIISNRVREVISSIPLHLIENEDRFIWPWTRKGINQLRVDINGPLIKCSHGLSAPSHSSHQIETRVWKLNGSLKWFPRSTIFYREPCLIVFLKIWVWSDAIKS